MDTSMIKKLVPNVESLEPIILLYKTSFISNSDAIGGKVTIQFGDLKPFKEITYSVDNAIKDQTWTKDQCVTTPFATTTYVINPTYSHAQTFYWNEVPGMRMLTVTVKHTDNSTSTKTFQWNIKAPSVESFDVVGDKSIFGEKNGLWGFYQQSPTYLRAQVNNIPADGELGVIQIVDAYDKYANSTTITTTDFSPSITALDWVEGQDALY